MGYPQARHDSPIPVLKDLIQLRSSKTPSTLAFKYTVLICAAANRLVHSWSFVSLNFFKVMLPTSLGLLITVESTLLLITCLNSLKILSLENDTNPRFYSAVDVNIYGSVGTDALRGNHENTEIGEFLREYLDVDVKAITDELVEKSKTFDIATTDLSWTGREPTVQDLYMVERHYEHLYGEAP
jgi:hypothetical protein